MAVVENAPTSSPGPEPATAPPEARAAERFDPLVGVNLADRYLIVRRVGEGGMGAVYEARHTVLDKRVAVKVLLEKFLETPELVARLLQEARLASAIGHENIVDVTDFGTTADGRAFVVMEYLEGEPLATLVLKDAPLPIERSLRMVKQVVSALAAAHAKGIIHRDVKPENVYLLRRGDADFVKVMDFGISKVVNQREEGAEWQRLTRTGMVLGTPLYMSPEQARGVDDVDHRADIWAVGVLLYECLTGEVPFRASNYLGVISQVLTEEAVPPSRLRPELGIPPAVEAVVMGALQKDRTQRYQTMRELERDLDRVLAGQDVGLPAPEVESPPPTRELGRRWHLLAASVLVLATGVSFALSHRGEPVSRDPAGPGRPPVVPSATLPASPQKPAPVAKQDPHAPTPEPEAVAEPPAVEPVPARASRRKPKERSDEVGGSAPATARFRRQQNGIAGDDLAAPKEEAYPAEPSAPAPRAAP